jgi:hypothetical protein
MLDQELAYFNEHKAEWLKAHKDRVALIKGRELAGLYDNENQAVMEGARRFGLQSFLVKRIQESAQEVSAPALALGILCADYPIICDPPNSDA